MADEQSMACGLSSPSRSVPHESNLQLEDTSPI